MQMRPSELKQSVFACRATKMLISDDFGVVYRIIDRVSCVLNCVLNIVTIIS